MQVSVIIPVYNAVEFVEQAVRSALFHPEVGEIILVEDGSQDGSLKICSALTTSFSKVHLHRHPGGENKGAGASRNLGIAKASMPFISFLDADDQMTKERYTLEKELFLRNPEIDGIYGATGTRFHDPAGKEAWLKKGFTEDFLTTLNKPVPPKELFDFLTGFCNRDHFDGHFSIDGLTVKREALLKNKIRFDESLKVHQDTYFIWHCAYVLTLVAGEISRPVAMRGVHRHNRFIQIKNVNQTRSLFYRAMIRWTREVSAEKKYRHLFAREFHSLNATDTSYFPFVYHTFLKYFYSSRLESGHTIDFAYLLLQDVWARLHHGKS